MHLPGAKIFVLVHILPAVVAFRATRQESWNPGQYASRDS
jgi:hypothetical protein